jgi:hypothetical protein
MPKLRFKALGSAMVPDIDAQKVGVRRFVGRKVAVHESGAAMFVPSDEPSEVSFHAEYIQAAQEGDLEPADEATAKACGLDLKPAKSAAKKEG